MRWKLNWKKFLKGFAMAFVLIGVPIEFVTGWATGALSRMIGQNFVQSACLAQTLDINLDKFGPGKNKELFIQQAAMAAEIHRRRVAEGKEFFCPPGNFWGKAELGRRWILSSSKNWHQSERLVIVQKAAKGEYKFEWPPEFAKANNYKATHLRVRVSSRGVQVGTIGNMTLYKE